jgi:DNA-binding response OmpR family regulator
MMRRLFLVHWHLSEAQSLAEHLVSSGWQVELESEDGGRAFSAIKASQPQCVVVSLARLPSHGRQTAIALRAAAVTRYIPILFVDGELAAIKKALEKVPGAFHTTSAELPDTLADLMLDKDS